MVLNIFGRTEIIQSNGARVVLEDVEVLNGNRLVGGAFVESGTASGRATSRRGQ